jgi:NAD(P)H-hydrate epimerase
MSRLCKKSVKAILDSTADTANDFAKKHSLVCVLKDHRTVISDGDTVYTNVTGNSGMATGGSGDVLAGILAGLLDQEKNGSASRIEIVSLGVYIHGRSGDFAADRLSEYCLTARDIITEIPTAIKEIFND